MSRDALFLYCVAAISCLFALGNGIAFIVKRSKTALTHGTVNSIWMPNPETARAKNSKWAIVTYKVNNKSYTSENRVQVPMSAQVGSMVSVRYEIDEPKKLCYFSLSKIVIPLGIAAVCLVLTQFSFV